MARIAWLIAVLGVAAALALSACTATPVPDPEPSPSVTVEPTLPTDMPAIDLTITGGDPSQLVGRWIPIDVPGSTEPDIEFRDDATWRASDGCNETEGTWTQLSDDRVSLTAGPSTLIGCEGVPTASLIQQATEVDLGSEAHMIWLDASGATLLELVLVDESA